MSSASESPRVELQRRTSGHTGITKRSSSFADIFSDWQPGKESFLLFAPHDDDSAISLALLIGEARRQNIPVRVVVVTDGRNGYVSLRDRDTIVERRMQETYESYKVLGVPASDIRFLEFPDGILHSYFGRRRAQAGDPVDEAGYTGLENHFVRELRRPVSVGGASISATRVFVPSPADYHQDHVAVARQVPIAIFHALGGIWPECGEKISTPPFLYWHCVYCPLPDGKEPTIRLVGNAAALQQKVASVKAYNSQGQIASILEKLRHSPPVEYLLEESFSLYHPGVYDHCFG